MCGELAQRRILGGSMQAVGPTYRTAPAVVTRKSTQGSGLPFRLGFELQHGLGAEEASLQLKTLHRFTALCVRDAKISGTGQERATSIMGKWKCAAIFDQK